MTTIAVLGSRNFEIENHEHYVTNCIDRLKEKYKNLTILTSDNKGVDRLVQKYCLANDIPFYVFGIRVSPYGTTGEAATVCHNHIIKLVKKVFVIWDGAGSHTKEIGVLTLNHGKSLEVIVYDGPE